VKRNAPAELLLLIPIYEDWLAVQALLDQIGALKLGPARLDVLLIDDGSPSPMPAPLRRWRGAAVRGASVLRLSRNVGHQAAIAVALSEVTASSKRYDAVLVMDGDGEDAPSDILRLLAAWEASGRRHAVFAQRQRRSEGPVFKLFYALYRLSYRALTGTWISMGNFSLLPWGHARQLVLYPELWRHYPATVKKSRLSVGLVATDRALRLGGRSKMNFYHLVLHGLGAITVHSDIVGVRALVAVGALLGACLAASLGLAWALGMHATQVPTWAIAALAGLTLVALQFLAAALIFSFLTLAGRSPLSLSPSQDYRAFVQGRSKLHGR
jgi:polyisoprenyl-phosphate glycosyltransferase